MIDQYLQPERGYRFSEDSLILAHQAPACQTGLAADFGAGCGVVGIEALACGRLAGLERLWLVEIDPRFRPSLKENLRRLKVQGSASLPKIGALWTDWRKLAPQDLGGRLDLILANPPYFPIGSSGPMEAGRQRARHATYGGIDGLLTASKSLLRPGGRLIVSWPRSKLGELTQKACALNFSVSKVHLPKRAKAGLTILELILTTRLEGGIQAA
ncbi:MAG: RsmD family RNA methyltransferase [Deltaproteobacteria bacterium]|nr:RsmD family RNA methyltransferase [Deltaproteobacteria bacterium]